MSRSLDAQMQIDIVAQVVYPALFVEVEFESGWYRVWTGLGEKTWDSKTWAGVGDLGSISDIEETEELKASGITLQLSGVDSSLIGSVIGDIRQGKQANVYFATMDDSQTITGGPYGAFKGKVDTPQIQDDGTLSTVQLTIENVLIELERPRLRRWNQEDQQTDYPNDLGFSQVAELAKTPYTSIGFGRYLPDSDRPARVNLPGNPFSRARR